MKSSDWVNNLQGSASVVERRIGTMHNLWQHNWAVNRMRFESGSNLFFYVSGPESCPQF